MPKKRERYIIQKSRLLIFDQLGPNTKVRRVFTIMVKMALDAIWWEGAGLLYGLKVSPYKLLISCKGGSSNHTEEKPGKKANKSPSGGNAVSICSTIKETVKLSSRMYHSLQISTSNIRGFLFLCTLASIFNIVCLFYFSY